MSDANAGAPSRASEQGTLHPRWHVVVVVVSLFLCGWSVFGIAAALDMSPFVVPMLVAWLSWTFCIFAGTRYLLSVRRGQTGRSLKAMNTVLAAVALASLSLFWTVILPVVNSALYIVHD